MRKLCCYRTATATAGSTSISGHKGRRSWMMRALHMLDSPCAPTLGIRRDFPDNLLSVSRVRRRGQAGAVEQGRTAVAETCAPA